ncbi:MAG: hypothetical protein AB8F78_08980 [Saprospiraceae bacterium]
MLKIDCLRLIVTWRIHTSSLVWVLLLCCSTSSFSQVNYDAGRNLKEWSPTGDYLVDSHAWFGDSLVISSRLTYIYDTLEYMQGDTIFTVIRYAVAQGIHVYPDEYLPATVNLIDPAYRPSTPPVEYKGKLYWGARKTFTPPDTSAWIALYEFDPKTLGIRTLTLHDAQSGSHYIYDLVIDGDLLSAITRPGFGREPHYMNIVDPNRWKVVAHEELEWTTGDFVRSLERMHTSAIQIHNGDTTVVFSGVESNETSRESMFFKFYNLDGQELFTEYRDEVFSDGIWLAHDRGENFDGAIIAQRTDAMLFFISNHRHPEFVADSTTGTDFKAYVIDPISYERLDSSDIGDPAFWDGMQALVDYATVGDTLVAVGQCGDTIEELELRPGDPNYNKTPYQLGVVAYDMNTLELIWKKRIIAETEFNELSKEYGVANSSQNFVSVTAMTWERNSVTNALESEVRIIHLNEHGCPTADPNKTCDDLIWLDQYVSATDDPEEVAGVVPSLEVVPSLLRAGSSNRLRFKLAGLDQGSSSSYTVQFFDNIGRPVGQSAALGADHSCAVPVDLSAGIYYAYLRSASGQSIGVGKFVVQ